MHYCEIKPHPALQRFIECVWTLKSESKLGMLPEPILPDGCIELILNCGDPFHELQDGIFVRQPARFVVGQMTRPVVITPTGKVELIGIRFNPGGTLPFFRPPLHELTNRVVELGSLDSTLERHLVEALRRAPLLPERVAEIQSCLSRKIQGFKEGNGFLNLTANAIRSNGRIRVEQLAAAAGVSGRQLERRFLTDVGIGPKMFCRILRFQHVFRALANNPGSWAELALDCGYYDQAHLIRDFQEFAHQTPASLLAESSQLTEVFTRKHRAS